MGRRRSGYSGVSAFFYERIIEGFGGLTLGVVENNEDSGPREVDLHGLYVKEAIFYTDRSIQEARNRGDSEIHLIVGTFDIFCLFVHVAQLLVSVGKGLHSRGGVAKLKPAIEELIQKYAYPSYPLAHPSLNSFVSGTTSWRHSTRIMRACSSCTSTGAAGARSGRSARTTSRASWSATRSSVLSCNHLELKDRLWLRVVRRNSHLEMDVKFL